MWFATTLGWKNFELTTLSGREAINQTFEYDAEVNVHDTAVTEDRLLGTMATAGVRVKAGTFYVNGYISSLLFTGKKGNARTYQISLVSWTSLLSKAANCAIFNERTVPSVIQKLLQDKKTAAYRMKLRRTYPAMPYFVQYRETDLNFFQRLVEHVGVVTYFEHGPQGHELVMVDTAEDYDSPKHPVVIDATTLSSWTWTSTLQPTRYVFRAGGSTDLTAPTLEATSAIPRAHAQDAAPLYDFEGTANTKAEMDFYARTRVEESQANARSAKGSVEGIILRAGSVLSLTHAGPAVAGQYLVSSVGLHVSPGSPEPTLRSAFDAYPIAPQYRPSRRTPWPVISGSHVAEVVGPDPEDATHVRVRFPWARPPGPTEISVKVAGAALGANAALPVAGSAVVVNFLEGEPSRPLVIAVVPKR